jgi:hypothetical protein
MTFENNSPYLSKYLLAKNDDKPISNWEKRNDSSFGHFKKKAETTIGDMKKRLGRSMQGTASH